MKLDFEVPSVWESVYELDHNILAPMTDFEKRIDNLHKEIKDYFSYSNKVLPNIKRCEVGEDGLAKLVEFDGPKNSLERKYLDMLEKTPDRLQKILNEKGLGVVFSHGPITDIPGLEDLKGVTPRGWPENYSWDNVRGLATTRENGAFRYLVALGVKEGFDYVGGSSIEENKNILALHEYFHNGNYILGKHFFGKSLSECAFVLNLMRKEKIKKRYFENPKEFVTESFQSYYFNNAVRKEFMKDWRKMNALIQGIETMIYYESKGNNKKVDEIKKMFV